MSLAYSIYISKYVLLPLLVVEMIIIVYMNSGLLWIWYITGQHTTIVNKFIIIQRICTIFYIIGCVVDYSIRLYGPQPITFISPDIYCSFWMIFYKFIFYTTCFCLFSVALIRLVCVEHPMVYHNRLDNNICLSKTVEASSQ